MRFVGVSPQVRLDLKERWGGQGRLGCDVGHGLLHRLPTFNVVASISADVAAEGTVSDDYLEPPSIEVFSRPTVTVFRRFDCVGLVFESLWC